MTTINVKMEFSIISDSGQSILFSLGNLTKLCRCKTKLHVFKPRTSMMHVNCKKMTSISISKHKNKLKKKKKEKINNSHEIRNKEHDVINIFESNNNKINNTKKPPSNQSHAFRVI